MYTRERTEEMADRTLQVRYDDLGNLASQANKMASEMQKLHSKIVSQTEALASSWTGRGADAFQQEMEEIVLPAFKRLYEGLGSTGMILNQLGTHWHGVEDEISQFISGSE
jgi:WXG100 family type VII secretion target